MWYTLRFALGLVLGTAAAFGLAGATFFAAGYAVSGYPSSVRAHVLFSLAIFAITYLPALWLCRASRWLAAPRPSGRCEPGGRCQGRQPTGSHRRHRVDYYVRRALAEAVTTAVPMRNR